MTIDPATLSSMRAAQDTRAAAKTAEHAATLPSWEAAQAAKAAFLAVANDPNAPAAEKSAKRKAHKDLAVALYAEYKAHILGA